MMFLFGRNSERMRNAESPGHGEIARVSFFFFGWHGINMHRFVIVNRWVISNQSFVLIVWHADPPRSRLPTQHKYTQLAKLSNMIETSLRLSFGFFLLSLS